MALLDFLKNKKEKDNAAKKAVTKPAKSVLVQPKAPKEEATPAISATNKKTAETFSYDIVNQPHISEKSSNLSAQNKYTFKVQKNHNKLEIKKSVEGIYGVDVVSVNVIKIPKKKRRLGQTEGFRKSYNKAIVTLKEGQKIEIF